MPRVHFVKKAQKDNDAVKKGESYYWWKFRYGGKHMSRTAPKQSQLTQSSFLSGLYSIQEDIESLTTDDLDQSTIDDLVGRLEELRDEAQDSLDNMPEQLQEGDVGQMLQERVDNVEDAISELEGLDMEIDEDAIREEVNDEYKNEIEEDEEEADSAELDSRIEEAIKEKKEELLTELQDINLDF